MKNKNEAIIQLFQSTFETLNILFLIGINWLEKKSEFGTAYFGITGVFIYAIAIRTVSTIRLE